MLVWGGRTPSPRDAGLMAFDPTTWTWTMSAAPGAPCGRRRASTVVAGGELLVWGGYEIIRYQPCATGAAYDVATDTWRTLPADGAPTARSERPAAGPIS